MQRGAGVACGKRLLGAGHVRHGAPDLPPARCSRAGLPGSRATAPPLPPRPRRGRPSGTRNCPHRSLLGGDGAGLLVEDRRRHATFSRSRSRLILTTIICWLSAYRSCSGGISNAFERAPGRGRRSRRSRCPTRPCRRRRSARPGRRGGRRASRRAPGRDAAAQSRPRARHCCSALPDDLERQLPFDELDLLA